MKTVPTAVICGVTSSFSTASIKVIEIVLLIVVWIGILLPCFSTAYSLLVVTRRGFERSLPTPRDSDAVMNKSTAKFAERCEKPSLLVGTPAPRLTPSGKPELVVMVCTGGPEPGIIGSGCPIGSPDASTG